MTFQLFRSLYEQCMEEVNHVPPERRSALLEIAETFNRLANECASEKQQSLLRPQAAVLTGEPDRLSVDDGAASFNREHC